jgi:4'-phosphopantetheinyl transferase
MIDVRIPGLARPEVGDVAVLVAELHVWSAQATQFEAWLGAEERHRMRRFARADLARSYVVAHGLLRWVLAQALGEAPETIAFHNGEWGKPSIVTVAGTGDPGLAFNLSHAANHVAIALATSTEVGIDVEGIDQLIPREVVDQCASPSERQFLAELGPADTRIETHALWTRKEALAKAAGRGLGVPFQDFSVIPRARAGVQTGIHLPLVPGAFSVMDLPLWRGCAGSVAWLGPPRSLRFTPIIPGKG